MRRSKPVRIGELWSGFVDENPGVSRRLREAQVPEAWAAAVGPAMNTLTRSVEVKNGILHVAMTSSVARQELFMRREELKNKLNAQLGAMVINSVIIK